MVFLPLNLDQTFPVEDALAAIPSAPMLKGMFSQGLVDRARAVGQTLASAAPSYSAFKDYPIAPYARLLVEAATALFPQHALKRALYEVGRTQFQVFSSSLLGKVMLAGMLGNSPLTLARATSRIYERVHSHARVRLVETGKSECILRYSDMWCFLDSNEVGTIVGGVEACGFDCTVEVENLTPSSGDVRVRWSKERG